MSGGLAKQRQKLNDALNDAHTSRQFIGGHLLYTESERAAQLQQVDATLASLQARLQQLGD